MQKITFRAIEDVVALMDDNYNSKAAAAEKVIPAFFELRKYTLHELKGVFTKEEINALAWSLSSTLQDADFQCNKGIFRAHLQDFELFEKGVSANNASLEDLLEKIQRLTASQLFFLQEEISKMYAKNLEIDYLYDLFL